MSFYYLSYTLFLFLYRSPFYLLFCYRYLAAVVLASHAERCSTNAKVPFRGRQSLKVATRHISWRPEVTRHQLELPAHAEAHLAKSSPNPNIDLPLFLSLTSPSTRLSSHLSLSSRPQLLSSSLVNSGHPDGIVLIFSSFPFSTFACI
jgi:hypothetical protein